MCIKLRAAGAADNFGGGTLVQAARPTHLEVLRLHVALDVIPALVFSDKRRLALAASSLRVIFARRDIADVVRL